jgi:hypothetical protein
LANNGGEDVVGVFDLDLVEAGDLPTGEDGADCADFIAEERSKASLVLFGGCDRRRLERPFDPLFPVCIEIVATKGLAREAHWSGKPW